MDRLDSLIPGLSIHLRWSSPIGSSSMRTHSNLMSGPLPPSTPFVRIHKPVNGMWRLQKATGARGSLLWIMSFFVQALEVGFRIHLHILGWSVSLILTFLNCLPLNTGQVQRPNTTFFRTQACSRSCGEKGGSGGRLHFRFEIYVFSLFVSSLLKRFHYILSSWYFRGLLPARRWYVFTSFPF